MCLNQRQKVEAKIRDRTIFYVLQISSNRFMSSVLVQTSRLITNLTTATPVRTDARPLKPTFSIELTKYFQEKVFCKRQFCSIKNLAQEARDSYLAQGHDELENLKKFREDQSFKDYPRRRSSTVLVNNKGCHKHIRWKTRCLREHANLIYRHWLALYIN